MLDRFRIIGGIRPPENRDDFQILYDEAQRQGMWTLREDGIVKATQGLVDVRDVLDVTRDEGDDD